jgi:hypothetical protein
MRFSQRGEILVEQFYTKLDENQTRLTFRSSLVPRKQLKRKVGLLKYKTWQYFFQRRTIPETMDKFEKNLINIKAAIEMKENYQRIYPYL